MQPFLLYPWYLATNLAGHLNLAVHLDLAGYYISKCPANSKCPAYFKCPSYQTLNDMTLSGFELTSPTISDLKVDALPMSSLGLYKSEVKSPF